MGFRLRKALKLGPLRVNLTQRGVSSYSVKAGPWSWNSRTKRHTVDTPGPGSWQSNGKKKPSGRQSGRRPSQKQPSGWMSQREYDTWFRKQQSAER